MLLAVRDLKTYFFTTAGTVRAVDGASYDVRAGETVALVGESGCGKSVSALSIMRLVAPPAGRIVGGEIRFRQHDLLRLDDEAMRRIRGRDIAMIFQEPMTSLNPVLSIGRQLTEPLEIHCGMPPALARKRAVELLTLVGLPDAGHQLARYPHHLSGGMRQRLMIAMALACDPSLILADEPTTALDVTIQSQILELLQDLCRRRGIAMVLITHNLGIVARYTDRVNVMYAGKFVEQGRARDLYAGPHHPYTRGLLRAVPRLDAPRQAKLQPIEGHPPDLTHVASGCAFAPRCRYAIPRCQDEVPPLLPVGAEHLSACWVAEQVGNEAAR